ncbi:MAG TPA: lysophospholipid acyltransferase family protein [Telmatospirillum sp.]|nr:lysophospholipid acyltransferase family protein [Telmatospirillum sp.]
MVKTLTRSEGIRRLLCWLAAQYIRLVYVTGRWQVVGGAVPQAFWDEGRPFILAFWHGRILMMPYCWRRRQPIKMLISQHRDGQIIARTVSHFGIETIVGSSSKGGLAALRGMLQSLKGGTCVGITPDGPRGPRMRASDGIAQVAKLSGQPVIPCSFSTKRRRILGSWDRFAVALPFSKGIFVWGTPINVPNDANGLREARMAIEASLNAITEQADRAMGHRPVEPAPRPEEADASGNRETER